MLPEYILKAFRSEKCVPLPKIIARDTLNYKKSNHKKYWEENNNMQINKSKVKPKPKPEFYNHYYVAGIDTIKKQQKKKRSGNSTYFDDYYDEEALYYTNLIKRYHHGSFILWFDFYYFIFCYNSWY